jgi:hypothetical protein
VIKIKFKGMHAGKVYPCGPGERCTDKIDQVIVQQMPGEIRVQVERHVEEKVKRAQKVLLTHTLEQVGKHALWPGPLRSVLPWEDSLD